MTSLASKFFSELKLDWKSFWDNLVKPELKVFEAAAENLQKQLAPIEENALKAIAGAGFAAFAVSGSLDAGATAAVTEAEKQGQVLTKDAALALVAMAAVPAPVVPNGNAQ